jgi:hypothetical protein
MSKTKNATSEKNNFVEFDLHGIVGVRLVNPARSDVNQVEYQLGMEKTRLNRQADIIIKFTKKIKTSGLTFLGLESAAFTKEGFYILSTGSEKTKIRIPFENIGRQCEILCESGLNWIPLLNLIVTLTYLEKGYIPLHASAFSYEGIGNLVMGWKTGGKTEALLSFVNNGAKYIGDEWICLSKNGDKMFGIPAPTSIKKWQFKYIPNLLPKFGHKNRLVLLAIASLQAFHDLLNRGFIKKTSPVRLLGQILAIMKKQQKIWLSPTIVFKNNFQKDSIAAKNIFLIMMSDNPKICIEPCSSQEIADRMIHSNTYDLMPLLEYYQAFKFAFPHLKNDLLEKLNEKQELLIYNALKGKRAYKIYRPYPEVSFHELFTKMGPFCKNDMNTKMAA